jgi:hypothetical protein
MIIGISQEAGFSEVPEDRFIRYMLAEFMSTMFVPDDSCPVCFPFV